MFDEQRQELLNDLLTDACAVVVRLVSVIPDDMQEARRTACAKIVHQVMLEVEHLLSQGADTQH